MKREELIKLREKYTEGTILELEKMTDPFFTIPKGSYGVVDHIDDMGTIFCNWVFTGTDFNGKEIILTSGLGICYGIDEAKIVADMSDMVPMEKEVLICGEIVTIKGYVKNDEKVMVVLPNDRVLGAENVKVEVNFKDYLGSFLRKE